MANRMTAVYFTIDTEYAAGITARQGRASREENFARSIACVTRGGAVGIGYQMDVFDSHGLKAVFFVDPMPALIWGVEAISDIVGPIVARGHDVQLHLHSEWLELAGPDNPLPGHTGTNIREFAFDDQCALLDFARGVLIAAGAPPPVAFRAGNYGASDDTLRALAEVGLRYDSSHCPGFSGSAATISLGPDDRAPVAHCGVVEVPAGCIGAPGGRLRHLQITAVSRRELTAAVRHAAAQQDDSITLVSHSFELLSRNRQQINHVVKRRFERFCADLAALADCRTATYAAQPPRPGQRQQAVAPLPCNRLRTGLRFAEQAVANTLYGAR